ncbi:MAG: heme peroxidase [Actinomycetota bacterium]|nr:heme peroxidase [Actinomycetota bacterium]
MENGRDTSRDGKENRREVFVLTHGAPLWKLAQRHPKVERYLNGRLVNIASAKMPYRPNPFSTMAAYTSWASLTDKKFSGRHLPGSAEVPGLPAVDEVADLFVRPEGQFTPCPKSTVLFSYFAQWFTDGFLRSDRTPPPEGPDPRKNDSNHEIDLMQIYGLSPDVTDQLRSHEGGLLKSQSINGEEYPPYLYDENGDQKAEFDRVSWVHTRLTPPPPEKQAAFFAIGSDTGNLQLGFVMMNVLFLREHNRVARELGRQYRDWDDDRLFETARNVMIVLLIRIVVNEYINHITPYLFEFKADPASFRNPPWYRANWMAVEFNLVYRWHPLVPPDYRVGGRNVSIHDTLYETRMLTDNGLGMLMEEASDQPAGKVGVFNTHPDLRGVQRWSVEKARAVQLGSYNDYRELCMFPRVTQFDQISGNAGVQRTLERLYGTVERIEFYSGLYAEDTRPNSVLPSLIGRMVGIDAFSQAFTNPLLSPRVFNEATFSPAGMEIITSTKSLSDIVHRNVPGPDKYFVSLTRRDWRRQ